MNLAERHLRALHEERAVPLEEIAARGYRTVTDPAELVALGFADYQARVPALLIPLHGPDGRNGRFALKPDHPRTGKDGRVRKYDYPSGSSHMLDVPPRCLSDLAVPSVPLLFSEGATKADVAAGLGYCAVNIWGTSAWYTNPQHGGFATIEPLGDWEVIKPTLNGRICYLAYDSDAWRNPNVARELRRLASWLAKHGALVFIIHLSDEPGGEKNGLDDFVARHGGEAFTRLVDQAEPWGSAGMVRKLQAELREMRQQQSALAEVLRNPDLRPTEKVVAVALVNESGWRQSAGAEMPFSVNCTTIAAATGLTRQTVGRAIDLLSAPGVLFEKQVTREYVEGLGWRSTVKLTPREKGGVVPMLKAAAVAKPERAAKKSRPQCPDHPNGDLVERRTLVCARCGQVVQGPTNRRLKLEHRTSDGPPSGSGEDAAVPLDQPGERLKFDVATPKYELGERLLGEKLKSQVGTSAACPACGRPWDVHGAVDNFGICDKPPPAMTSQDLARMAVSA